MKKILGILVLVLFLGTVMAGLAQESHGLPMQEKVGSGTPGEIKPYIVVKRTTEDQDPLNKWGGSAAQSSDKKFGVALVVGVRKYLYSKGDQKEDFDFVIFNATAIGVGKSYYLGNGEWMKMKYLWLGASKDYLPGKVGDRDLNIGITDDGDIAMWNLTNTAETSEGVKWLKALKPYIVTGVSAAADGIIAYEGGGILYCLAGSNAAGSATEYIIDQLIHYYAEKENLPGKRWNVSKKEIGYAYVKSLQHADWNKDNAAIAMPFEVKLYDDPKNEYQNHIITIRAIVGYDVAKKGWSGGWSWENKVKTVETYVTIQLVSDTEEGRGEPQSTTDYGVLYTYDPVNGDTGTFKDTNYINAGNNNVEDLTESTPLQGYISMEEYRTLHAGDYQKMRSVIRYYQGLLTGSDKADYWIFRFDPFSEAWIYNPDSYEIKLDLIAGGGAPMKMDVDYRGVHYTLSTKDKRIATLEIWSPVWKSGQTQGKIMKIKVYPDKVMKSADSGYQIIDSQGVYLLSFTICAYKIGNYQPYVHITGISKYKNHAWVSFHAEDKKNADWDSGDKNWILYSYTVYWGDGTKTTVTHVDAQSIDKTIDHIYSSGGTYTVKVEVEDYYSYSYGNGKDVEGTSISVSSGGGGGGGCPFLYTHSGNN